MEQVKNEKTFFEVFPTLRADGELKMLFQDVEVKKITTNSTREFLHIHLLPEGTLDYFDLVDVKESVNEVVFYLEEKNIVPEKYTDQDTESKGFYDPVIVQDFPLRGKKVFLNIRRRRWLLKKHNEYISRNWRMVAEGTRMTQDFASFLKELY